MYKIIEKTANNGIILKLIRVNNNTFIARNFELFNPNDLERNGTEAYNSQGYDSNGALIYVCVVLLFYAFSIVLMIGSSMKRGLSEDRISRYGKDIEQVHRLERRQEKYKTRLAMIKNTKSRSRIPAVNFTVEESVHLSVEEYQDQNEQEMDCFSQPTVCQVHIEDHVEMSRVNTNCKDSQFEADCLELELQEPSVEFVDEHEEPETLPLMSSAV